VGLNFNPTNQPTQQKEEENCGIGFCMSVNFSTVDGVQNLVDINCDLGE
jgi:hypothetical protein